MRSIDIFGGITKLLDKTKSSLHGEIRNIISAKLDALLSGCIIRTSHNHKVDAYSTIYKGGNCTLPKVCKMTGLDFSMQGLDITILSHTGIIYDQRKEPNMIK